MGFAYAGATHIVGVDIDPQPNYPFKFVQRDAFEYAERYLEYFDFVHGSPPCQAFSDCANFNPVLKERYPNLIPQLRKVFQDSGKPYSIENVPGAPLVTNIQLCGTMFPKLRVYRHRKFECNFDVRLPEHGWHLWKGWEFSSIAGNSRWTLQKAKRDMNVGWMQFCDEVVEAIPPQYTEYIGKEFLHGA